MGKPTGFLEYERANAKAVSPKTRVKNFNEFHTPLSEAEQRRQGARCMECGVPFCQSGMMIKGMTSGCPLNNLIPEWNDLVYTGNWKQAYNRLKRTNSFPEFTSRVCPAPCEAACTCGLNGDPVSIKENEFAVIEKAYADGLAGPKPPKIRTGKKVAVIGSGPAGLAAADQLNKRGHSVTVYEREDRVGGLLMYGIPNMKLEKQIIERKIAVMEAEGVTFVTGADVGKTRKAEKLLKEYDSVILACGASNPRDINAPGRDADGIYFAVDFLKSTTKCLLAERDAKLSAEAAEAAAQAAKERKAAPVSAAGPFAGAYAVEHGTNEGYAGAYAAETARVGLAVPAAGNLSGDGTGSMAGVTGGIGISGTPRGSLSAADTAMPVTRLTDGKYISAKGKHVIVIGGGDTGNDCVGTSIRHGCKSVIQLEMMPKPPEKRTEDNSWPEWPRILKTDYGQEEAIAAFGGDPRIYQTTVKEFKKNKEGRLCAAVLVSLTPQKDEKTGRTMMVPVEGSEREVPADLVLIAAGFLGSQKYVSDAFGVKLNARTNVDTAPGSYKTNVEKVFAAGDMHRGQSLVVWAIREGREVAKEVDAALMGYTNLM